MSNTIKANHPAGQDRRFRLSLLLAALLAAALALAPAAFGAEPARPAPEFSSKSADDWLNSKPLGIADFRGRVLLIDVWTYSCYNCYRSIPWLLDVERKYDADEFAIVGIHSPEFNHERDRRNVARKLKEFAIEHPVLIDNDFRYWQRLKNRYWPTFYLVGKSGRIRSVYIGETHSDTKKAKIIEAAIDSLLAEAGPASSSGAAPGEAEPAPLPEKEALAE